MNPKVNSKETKYVEMIRKELEGLEESLLTQLGKKLFPIMSSSNIYASMYNCFHTFYTIRLNKGETFQDGTRTILKFCDDLKNPDLLPRVQALLDNQDFQQGLQQLIRNELNERRNVISIDRNFRKQNSSKEAKIVDVKNTDNKQPRTFDPTGQSNPKNRKSVPMQNVVDISEDSPSEKVIINPNNGPMSMNGKNAKNLAAQQKSNLGSQQRTNSEGTWQVNLNSDPYQVTNLMTLKYCFCGKSCHEVGQHKENTFRCQHCKNYYHVSCMRRGRNALTESDPIKKLASCAFCHLERLVPIKQSQKVLFVGMLRQGRKRHNLSFNLEMADLKTKRWRVQVRCFRLKQKIQNFVLFPDSAAFSVNNRFEKEFLPLPKQSSLKYRKDQPFLLTQHLVNHENKITIIERIPKKESRDDRIEPQNHLLGIYMVEDKLIPSLVREIKSDSFFSYTQSKALLDRSFKIGNAEDITCQVVKIPVICTLTIERIKTPVRGIFCSHFQCFDLNNYLVLTSSSANPRWLCPLCKMPAYEFKYDVIVGAILEAYGNLNPTEIMFFNSGDFKVYNNEEVLPSFVNNISELNIQGKYKRNIQMVEEEQMQRQADKDISPKQIQSSLIPTRKEKNNELKESQITDEENKADENDTTANGKAVGNKTRTEFEDNNQLNFEDKKYTVEEQKSKDFQIPENSNVIDLDDD